MNLTIADILLGSLSIYDLHVFSFYLFVLNPLTKVAVSKVSECIETSTALIFTTVWISVQTLNYCSTFKLCIILCKLVYNCDLLYIVSASHEWT